MISVNRILKNALKLTVLLSALGFLFVFFVISMVDLSDLYSDDGMRYFFEHGYAETGAKNLVTAILLDYRLFDSLFEAGILLVAVSGVIWISKHDLEEKNVPFMIDKHKTPDLFVTFARLAYPLLLVFGFYIIINGHLSPGGGFQGGALAATAILILYYIDTDKETNVNFIVTSEKLLYLAIIAVTSVSLLTRGVLFTNFMPIDASADWKAIYLVILNLLIGLKVALGLWTIFTAFLREGR